MGTAIRLSRVLRGSVDTADGRRVGRIVDVSIRIPGIPVVHQIAVGRGRRPTHVIPWRLVDRRVGTGRRLRLLTGIADVERYRVGTKGLGDEALDPHELFLRRDVLDSQVIDLSGRRLCRVSDVMLGRAADGNLTVSAVDVGVGALLARMGLAAIGRHVPASLVAWDELHLVSARGHSVQLAVSADGLRGLDASHLSEVVARLKTEQATEVLRAVGPAHAARALDVSHHHLRRRLLRALEPAEAARVVDAGSESWRHDFARSNDGMVAPRRRFRRTAGWRAHRPTSPAP